MSRPSADARLQRLLVMVPWVMQHDGPTVEEVCERFAVDERTLAADLEMLFLCGLYPFTPDTLIEADIVDGRVYIRSADAFDRPPTFTPEEGISLLAAASTVAKLPGNEGNAPLHSALAKLTSVMGLDDASVDVDLTAPSSTALDAVRRAIDEQRAIEVDYYSWGRDALSRRCLEPHRVFNTEGQWYVFARARGEVALKTFRVDRMHDVVVTDDRFVPADEVPGPTSFSPHGSDPVVVLELDPSAAWVATTYPTEAVEERPEGHLLVTLRVSEPIWLERLLLRVGRHARVVEGGASATEAARRVLLRYGAGNGDD